MLPRFFFDGSIAQGVALSLPEKSSHHLARVLRLKIKDEVVVFNGEGGEYRCVIESIDKKSVTVLPLSFSEANRTSEPVIHLGLAVLKNDVMDRALSRATELGAQIITPVIADNSTVAHKIIHKRQAHWQQVVLSACEQCGLNLPPTLMPPITLLSWLQTSTGTTKLIALGDGDRFEPTSRTGSIDLAIGPEGGFAQHELEAARQSNFTPVRFGPRVLRAETAPVAAISTLRYALGE